jgi:hypothetical protein
VGGLKNIARDLTPPLIWRLAYRGRKSLTRNKRNTVAVGDGRPELALFDGDAEFLTRYGPSARVYGEYGVGVSTLWMARNSDASIIAVDSSREWIARVTASMDGRSTAIRHVDLGELANWGRPRGYERRNAFQDYVRGIWNRETPPDLVLLDGRFRVACFLTSCLEAAPGTMIIVDDYTGRREYHVMEEFLDPVDVNRRQALFRVPRDFDRDFFRSEAERFLYVMT